MRSLLSEALDDAVVFLPWSAGVMAHFEHDFYEKELEPDELNERWWELVEEYQKIVPPKRRGKEHCDACTKTHIIDDPAQYYDYALATMLKYQLHDYIAREILHEDPYNCNYYGHEAVGDWLMQFMRLGATKGWRNRAERDDRRGTQPACHGRLLPASERLPADFERRRVTRPRMYVVIPPRLHYAMS